MAEWAEFRGKCGDGVARAWALMHDPIMALGSVFEMNDGRFKAVYNIAGQVLPFVDGPFFTKTDAARHMESVVSRSNSARLVRPRPVILDQAFI